MYHLVVLSCFKVLRHLDLRWHNLCTPRRGEHRFTEAGLIQCLNDTTAGWAAECSSPRHACSLHLSLLRKGWCDFSECA